eukprot:3644195-Pyramimonas_sp.AAC.1
MYFPVQPSDKTKAEAYKQSVVVLIGWWIQILQEIPQRTLLRGRERRHRDLWSWRVTTTDAIGRAGRFRD